MQHHRPHLQLQNTTLGGGSMMVVGEDEVISSPTSEREEAIRRRAEEAGQREMWEAVHHHQPNSQSSSSVAPPHHNQPPQRFSPGGSPTSDIHQSIITNHNKLMEKNKNRSNNIDDDDNDILQLNSQASSLPLEAGGGPHPIVPNSRRAARRMKSNGVFNQPTTMPAGAGEESQGGGADDVHANTDSSSPSSRVPVQTPNPVVQFSTKSVPRKHIPKPTTPTSVPTTTSPSTVDVIESAERNTNSPPPSTRRQQLSPSLNLMGDNSPETVVVSRRRRLLSPGQVLLNNSRGGAVEDRVDENHRDITTSSPSPRHSSTSSPVVVVRYRSFDSLDRDASDELLASGSRDFGHGGSRTTSDFGHSGSSSRPPFVTRVNTQPSDAWPSRSAAVPPPLLPSTEQHTSNAAGVDDDDGERARVAAVNRNRRSSSPIPPVVPVFRMQQSRMRAYLGETPFSTLHAQPTFVVGVAATTFIMACTYILQHHVLDTKDHIGLFFMGSYVAFSSYFMVHFFLEKYSTSFRKISQDKKFYTISNILKASMLAAITPFALRNLYLIIVHDSWDTNTLRNLGCVYAIPDFVSLLVVKRMAWTTVFHHVCVFMFNAFSIHNDYNEQNVCRLIVVYAAFSTFAYVVNMLLASRFLGVSGKVSKVLAFLALSVYVLCCAINWTWQAHYLRRLIQENDHWTIYLYMMLICFVMWDDIVLNKWLLRNFRNSAATNSHPIHSTSASSSGGLPLLATVVPRRVQTLSTSSASGQSQLQQPQQPHRRPISPARNATAAQQQRRGGTSSKGWFGTGWPVLKTVRPTEN